MNKKDYEYVANAIAFCKSIANEQGNAVLDQLIEELIVTFKEENPRFNATQFTKACNDYSEAIY